MKKRVNIKSSNVLYVFTPPMSGVFNNHVMTTGDIKNCLLQGAYIEEILEDGRTIKLDLTNFDKDHSLPKVEVKENKKEINVEEPKVELPKKPEPVVETPVEEVKVESNTEVEAPVEESTDTHPVVEDSTTIESEAIIEEQQVEEVKEEQVETEVEEPQVQKQQNNYQRNRNNHNRRK